MGSSELIETVGAMVRRFAEDRIAPSLDRLERGEETPFALMKEMAEALGFDAVAASAVEPGEEKSGSTSRRQDLSVVSVVLKELSRVSPGYALSFGASIGLCGRSILSQGTPEQRRRWARPVLAFEKIGAWALTEPDAGSDAFSLRTVARKVDDGWALTGSKTFITNAPFADVMVVYARLDHGQGPTDRIGGFVVEKGMPGLEVSAPMEKMGMRASPTGAIYLDEVRVSDDHLLGDSDQCGGRRVIMASLLGERVALCALALGIIERSLEEAVSYAKERTQFGQPIAQFQAVQLRLARMYAAQETVRSLLDRGLEQIRQGQPDLAFLCAAKYTASTLATQVALEAVQVLGGNGYMQEYRVEMLARDAKLLEIGGGTSDIQLLTIARELLK